MTTNLMQASSQWATRPDDERFISLQELYESGLADDQCSSHEWIVNADLVAKADPENESAGVHFSLKSGPEVKLTPTHWAFGQVCQQATVPVRHIRKLHPALAAMDINYCMDKYAVREEQKLLVKRNGGALMRSVTSPSYGYIPNHLVTKSVMHMNEKTGNYWEIPAASYSQADPRRATTLYKGDRNQFIFLVDPHRPVEFAGTDGKKETLFRGFFITNSEVGNMVLGITTFLYRYVCDNRIVWGAEDVKEVRMRHSKFSPERFEREGPAYLMRYAESSPALLEDKLRNAATIEIGKTRDKGIEWLVDQSFTKSEATRVVEFAENEEGGSRSLWDIVNGGTALARGIKNTDDRIDFERKVSKLLDLAA